MAIFSILDSDGTYKDTVALSPYYIDFNIDRIMKEINAYWKEDVSAMYRYFPSDEQGQEYRKSVYKDICRDGMYEILVDFREEMKNRAKILENKKQTRSELQKMVMTLSEMKIYLNAVDTLYKRLSEVKLESEGMTKLMQLLSDYVSSDRYKKLEEEVSAIRKSLDDIPIKLRYKDHFLYVSFEEVEGKYDSFLKEFSTPVKDNQKFLTFFQRKNPLGDAVEITALEEEVITIIYEKKPQVFGGLTSFIKEAGDYAEEYILQLADEIAFYLSFLTFERVMKERGLYFVPAKKSDSKKMVAEDLYDLALACQMSRDGIMPIANDTRMEEDENFFVLTGPNQGGKTTFARSLGQLVFFSKLGLPVPAKRAEIPFYARILTHFSVEESVETGKGKLAEELTRLAPMMEDSTQKNDFVVINELFTTAANYDACIMGKRVLDHFVGQGCHGIYVTHLQDLSKEDPGIVSLRAMMNEEHRQNFKIVRSTDPALESSILLVEKHRLHFEQVKNRLKGEEE